MLGVRVLREAVSRSFEFRFLMAGSRKFSRLGFFFCTVTLGLCWMLIESKGDP
jgi:hypothetical protein